MTVEIYQHEEYVISTDQERKYFIAGKDFSFYRLNSQEFAAHFDFQQLKFVRTIRDSIAWALLPLIVISITLYFYFTQYHYVIIDQHFLIATLLLVINIPLHELGHILFLKLFYKESEVKCGFKLIFIYPAFYVNTSYSYLLPKYKRISVYLAGNFINSLFLLIVICFFKPLLPYCYLIFAAILVNLLPIVKSDGYYALKTLYNGYNKAQGKIRDFIENFIRGLLMFLFLYMLSYLSELFDL